MRFFLDNNLAPRYADMLVALGVDAVALRRQYPQNADDLTWIPQVAQNGWIIITSDSEMNRRRAEKEALRQHGAIAFFLRDGFNNQIFWRKAKLLCKYWPTIEQLALKAKPGEMFDVMLNGRISLRPR